MASVIPAASAIWRVVTPSKPYRANISVATSRICFFRSGDESLVMRSFDNFMPLTGGNRHLHVDSTDIFLLAFSPRAHEVVHSCVGRWPRCPFSYLGRGIHETRSFADCAVYVFRNARRAGLGEGEAGEISTTSRMGYGEARWTFRRGFCRLSGIQRQASRRAGNP